VGFSFGALLNLGGRTDGDSFASKYGSLFQTDEQKLLEQSAQQDIGRQSAAARANLERINTDNVETATATNSITGTGPRNLTAKRVDQTSPTDSNVQYRTMATGPAGSLKA
jgi:hypothetical protein